MEIIYVQNRSTRRADHRYVLCYFSMMCHAHAPELCVCFLCLQRGPQHPDLKIDE